MTLERFSRSFVLSFAWMLLNAMCRSLSMLSRELIERAYFRGTDRAPLSCKELGIVDVFGIFAHQPRWDEAHPDRPQQGRLASRPGRAPTASEIFHVEIKDRYVVGEKIGVWPIFSLSEDEIVAGRNNKHMDFRLSVLKVLDGDRTKRGGLHHLHGSQPGR